MGVAAYSVAFAVLAVALPAMVAFYNVPCTLFMTSLFPAEFRGRGAGLGLGLASLAGGFTPVICSVLARQEDWLPGVFVALLTVPSLAALWWSRRAARRRELVVFQRP